MASLAVLADVKKKSQIFIFDLIFSFVIILLSVSLLYVFYIGVNDDRNVHQISNNIINSFTNTKINDLNNEQVRNFFINAKIRNIENSVAEQIMEFYSEGQHNDAKDLTEIFIKDYSDKTLSFQVNISSVDGTLSYMLYRKLSVDNVDMNSSKAVAYSSRVLFSFRNRDIKYGPYRLEVFVWQ